MVMHMQRAGCAISAVHSVTHLEVRCCGTWHAPVTLQQWKLTASKIGTLHVVVLQYGVAAQ
jgi:hypothetical protein